MNALISNYTGLLPPLVVVPNDKEDMPYLRLNRVGGASDHTKSWHTARDNCVKFMVNHFGKGVFKHREYVARCPRKQEKFLVLS